MGWKAGALETIGLGSEQREHPGTKPCFLGTVGEIKVGEGGKKIVQKRGLPWFVWKTASVEIRNVPHSVKLPSGLLLENTHQPVPQGRHKRTKGSNGDQSPAL